MSKTIWIVYGKTGEYDDSRDWLVCAFSTKALAKKRLNACVAEACRLLESKPNEGRYIGEHVDYEDRHDAMLENECDLQMDVDYNGVKYGMYELMYEDK
jgi:hypothetical protein